MPLPARKWGGDPSGRDLLKRCEKAHGGLHRWNRVRNLEISLDRRWLAENGDLVREEPETQFLLKGRRPRILLESPSAAGWRVRGLDGRRTWVTVNGFRHRGEGAWAEAARETRWQAFVARFPFIFREKDARHRFLGGARCRGREALVVDVRYGGGTRPSEESYQVYLDASNFRLLRVDYDRSDTTGSHYRLELDRYSWVAGIRIPFQRVYMRKDGRYEKREELRGIRVNQPLDPARFVNPVRAPERSTTGTVPPPER